MVSDFCQISDETSNFAEAVGKFASAQRLDAEVSLFKGNEGDMWPERGLAVFQFSYLSHTFPTGKETDPV